MVCGQLSVSRKLPCFPFFLFSNFWPALGREPFLAFLNPHPHPPPCEDWFNTSAFSGKGLIVLFAAFSIDGDLCVFLEIFVVGELLLLLHCPSALPCWDTCTLGQVAAHCWGQAASEEGIVLQIAMVLNNSICWGFSCTLQMFRAPGVERQATKTSLCSYDSSDFDFWQCALSLQYSWNWPIWIIKKC